MKGSQGIDIGLPGFLFIKLPHKGGGKFNVGNPLSKDFLHFIEEDRLVSNPKEAALTVAQVSRQCAYWKNNHERIEEQMVVWLERTQGQGLDLPGSIGSREGPPGFGEGPSGSGEGRAGSGQRWVGAILPQVIPAGTVTRRAVERTWMTASNAYPDRIGSEQKAMIQAPPGWNFVGADVDSQELWIAAIIGDSALIGPKMHGATPFSWQ